MFGRVSVVGKFQHKWKIIEKYMISIKQLFAPYLCFRRVDYFHLAEHNFSGTECPFFIMLSGVSVW